MVTISTKFQQVCSIQFLQRKLTPVLASAVIVSSIVIRCDNQPTDDLSSLRNNTLHLPEHYSFLTRTGLTSAAVVADREVIVLYNTHSQTDRASVEAFISAFGGHLLGSAPSLNMYQYQVASANSMNPLLDFLATRSEVLTAQPDYALYGLRDPNPPVQYTVDTGYWWINYVNLPRAWDITNGSPSIPIGIVDNYIDLNIAGLAKPGNHQHIFCQSRFTIPYFADRFDDPNCIVVPNTHGTSVATLLAARGDIGIPGLGIAWQNTIVSDDISGGFSDSACPSGSLPTIFAALGVYDAIDQGARVVNVSLGLNSNHVCLPSSTSSCSCNSNPSITDQQVYRAYERSLFITAIRHAVDRNVLVVFGSGNDGFKHDDQLLPAANVMDVPNFNSNVIIVGGTDDVGNPSCALSGMGYSESTCRILPPTPMDRCNCTGCGMWFTPNPGTTEGAVVELSAPGYRIATRVGTGFNIESGTSFSAPIVSGIAALAMGVAPGLPVSEIKSILLNTARPSTACRQIGRGIVDAYAAVNRARELNGALSRSVSLRNGRNFSPYNFVALSTTSDRNFLLAGVDCGGANQATCDTYIPSNPPPFVVSKINLTGDVLWTIHLAPTGFFLESSIVETADGNYIALMYDPVHFMMQIIKFLPVLGSF